MAIRTTKLKVPQSFCVGCGSHSECTQGPMVDAIVSFGIVHGYTAVFYRSSRGAIILQAGCRKFRSSAAARKHWKGGANPFGELRPNAEALVCAAERAAKRYNLKWK